MVKERARVKEKKKQQIVSLCHNFEQKKKILNHASRLIHARHHTMTRLIVVIGIIFLFSSAWQAVSCARIVCSILLYCIIFSYCVFVRMCLCVLAQ